MMQMTVETITLTMDNKGRITIPARMRNSRQWVAVKIGQEIEIIPRVKLKDLRGIAPKLSTRGLRDEKDRVI